MQRLELESLVGATLDRCQFSKSGYSFEFSNGENDDQVKYKLHTSFFVAIGEGVELDVKENFSNAVWPFLETKLLSVSLDQGLDTLTLRFKDGVIKVWPGDLLFMDNLALLEDMNTGLFSTIL